MTTDQSRLDREADQHRPMNAIDVAVFCGAVVVSAAIVVYAVSVLWGMRP